MLNQMRGAASGFVAKLLLAVLVLSFAVWGIADVFRGGSSSTVVTAGDATVSIDDYALAYQQGMVALSRQLQRRPTAEEAQMFGLDQRVLRQVVAGATLDAQADAIGLGLSKDRLARSISEDPSFQDSAGNFSRTAFTSVLRNARIKEDTYIQNRAAAAKRSQIVEAVSEGIKLPQVFRTALGLRTGERRTIDYVTLTPALVQPVAEPSADQLRSYYEAHKSDYRAPEYRALVYAELTPEQLSDPSAITDQEVDQDYDRNRQHYTTPERRRIQQIVYPDRASADAAAAKLAAGSSFEDLVTASGRSLSDTELGLLGKSDIPDPAVADAAFELQQGQPSGVVEGTFGPVILRVTDIQPEEQKPLDAVRDDIRKELALEAARQQVFDIEQDFEDARAGGATLQEAAAKAKLNAVTIKAVDEQGNGPDGKPVADLPAADKLLPAVFATDAGLDNPPLNLGADGYLFYDVASVDPARDRTLDEVHDKVVADWKAGETARLLDERANGYKTRIEAGESLEAIAAEAGVAKATATAVTRQSGIQELGQSAVAAAFAGPQGLVATAPASDAANRLVLKVAEVAPPADPLSNVSQAQADQLSELMANDVADSYVTLLQSRYPVRVNQNAMEQARSVAR
ncbi:peptidyl-prolyl cis-trans isomerase [Mangrovibrevibacter kandeliae]|uniref:peptidyl-prolyl cis-trans isomerase n=1 Tax=Mangrovibrevibacter kandeliae TaxID=2968473 RepID=UPI0021191C82|nr:peptidyl-prolyl cis-trans isomerase [Aurantimonas sp. CSK15Z-1]MCQ8782587.1 peptidyl-prolyl cis-trans isomerase [Aurantimonas sp. CSK15Z-1]